jgi:hypothetical protein
MEARAGAEGGDVKRIQAAIIRDGAGFVRDEVRLLLLEDLVTRHRFLCSDGIWREAEAGARPSMPEDVEIGIGIPSAAVEEIAAAIYEFHGTATHGATEAKVLREALDVERARVDAVLARVIPR